MIEVAPRKDAPRRANHHRTEGSLSCCVDGKVVSCRFEPLMRMITGNLAVATP